MIDSQVVAAATAAVREAGALALTERAQGLAVEAKARQDFVTQADRAVERLLRERLPALLPGSEVLGEEEGGAVAADRLWVVDPIDGTTNYIRGLPHWCVSVALLERGALRLGLVYAPELDWLYRAEAGKGAMRNGEPLRRVPVAADEALLDLGQSRRQTPAAFGALIAGLREQGLQYRVIGSAALGLAMAASGEVDGFCEGHLWPWDVLAGLLIAHEAGCYVSEYLEGDAMRYGNAVLAAAPGIEEAVLRAADGALADSLPRWLPPA
ncbi:MAG: inositol monophosphatase [Alphaproteobacteria bacterium]|nr:inositol monophosphatase [Alphaproteobacteria bacterium]MCB9928428.1 inositol monophosphatase [Alphaproteobacteria bacterium]